MYAKITKDLLDLDLGDEYKRTELVIIGDPKDQPVQALVCRVLDDDGEIYYELIADDEALEGAFDWCQRDTGTVLLQVWTDGRWIDTIG